jgi:peptide alpha-N-acetyltransferase
MSFHQALDEDRKMIGVVVSKLEPHRGGPLRGYIAMLAVRDEWRGRGIATELVQKALDRMIEQDAAEVDSPIPIHNMFCLTTQY